MSENTDEAEPESESDIEVNLSAPDRVAYDELVDEFSEDLIISDLEEVVKERVRSLYDNQGQIRQRIAQAQQAAASR